MHFVDTRELQEGVQQQLGRHVGVVDVRVQWVSRERQGGVGGGSEGGRGGFGPARVGMNELGMLEVEILWVVVAAVAHKL